MTAASTIFVTADWALWGKGAGDAGYRLLACSSGAVSPDNFEGVLTRYSPGTLDSVPQITLSWLSDRGREDYLAIAIHQRAARDPGTAGSSASGRAGSAALDGSAGPAVLTSYFCVPFQELAAVGVSYQAMYEGFRAARLPADRHAPVRVELAAAKPAAPTAESVTLAMRAAALLLTGKPVCIVGASGTRMTERVQFLDAVASLLPYGLRSRLSAATWASSTYQEHRFRLFFASTPRRRDDHLLTWGQADTTAIEDPSAAAYLAWLADNAGLRATRLAEETEVIGFTRRDIAGLLTRVGAAHPAAGPAGETGPEAAGQRPNPWPSMSRVWVAPRSGSPWEFLRAAQESPAPAEPAGFAEPRHPLWSIAGQLEDDDLRPAIAALGERLAATATAPEQKDYQQIIKDQRLLRADWPADQRVQADLYDALLPLAFGRPLTYEGYCSVEDCAGTPPGQLLPASLLLAMDRTDITEQFTRTLVRLFRLRAAGELPPGRGRRDDLLTAENLVSLAVEPQLRRHHARLVQDTMHDWVQYPDRRGLREHLRRCQYRSQQLAAEHPSEPEYQVTVLSWLLRLAYGGRLDRSAAGEILDSSGYAPTAALLSAVLINMDSASRNRERLKKLLRSAIP